MQTQYIPYSSIIDGRPVASFKVEHIPQPQNIAADYRPEDDTNFLTARQSAQNRMAEDEKMRTFVEVYGEEVNDLHTHMESEADSFNAMAEDLTEVSGHITADLKSELVEQIN